MMMWMQFLKLLASTITILKMIQRNDNEIQIFIDGSVKEVVELLDRFENESVPNGKRKRAMVHHVKLNAYSLLKGEDLTISFYTPNKPCYNVYVVGIPERRNDVA